MRPALIDLRTGARVALAQYGTFDLPFARDATGVNCAAYADLIGPNIGDVMRRVGWKYVGACTRVDAFLPSAGRDATPRVVATGWAGPIRALDGTPGINISYGVGASHRGAALSRLLAYCAVAECMAHQVLAGAPLPTFVNIQARTTNAASLAVASSLGVSACPEAGFIVPERGQPVEYLGFREPVVDFLGRGLEHTVDRLPGYDPGSMAAARIGVVADEGVDLDLLGLLEGSMADEVAGRSESMRP